MWWSHSCILHLLQWSNFLVGRFKERSYSIYWETPGEKFLTSDAMETGYCIKATLLPMLLCLYCDFSPEKWYPCYLSLSILHILHHYIFNMTAGDLTRFWTSRNDCKRQWRNKWNRNSTRLPTMNSLYQVIMGWDKIAISIYLLICNCKSKHNFNTHNLAYINQYTSMNSNTYLHGYDMKLSTSHKLSLICN
jgi:hypothetical protein